MSEAQKQDRVAGNNGPETAQRDGQGRFAAGNRGGPGNPFARQTAALRKALVNAVTEKDIEEIVQALLAKAKQGDTAASRLILSYTLGKPAPVQDPDTLDQKELAILAGNHVDGGELQRIASLFPVDLVLEILRVILPYLGMVKAQQVQDLFEGKPAAAGSGDPFRAQVLRQAQEVDPCRIFDEEKDEDEEEEEEDEEEVHGGGSDAARARNDKTASSVVGEKELAEALAGFDRETELLKAMLGIPPEERKESGSKGEGRIVDRQTEWAKLREPKANGFSANDG